jgi:hypothetical protein
LIDEKIVCETCNKFGGELIWKKSKH